MSTSNPNRQRLMSPLDYLGAMAGATPPPQEQPMPMYDVPFQVGPAHMPPPPPPPQFAPMAPMIPPEVEAFRRSWGY